MIVFTTVLPSNATIQASLWPIYHTSLSDDAPLSAILAKSILHRWMNRKQSRWPNQNLTSSTTTSMAQQLKLTPECLHLRTTALQYISKSTRLISTRLSGASAASDANLLAVMELVCCYTSALLSDEVINHVSGLKQLIRLRGGLKKLPAFLAYRAIMSDNVVAAMTGRKPQLDDSLIEEGFRDDDDEVADVAAIIADLLNNPSPQDIQSAFRLLSQAFETDCFTSHLAANVLLIERRLLHDFHNIKTGPGPESSGCCPVIAQAIRLAFIIYIELNTAATWRYSAVLGSLTARLQALLEKTQLGLLWMPYTDALLLTLLLGGVGAIGHHPQRAWYVETLGLIAGRLEVRDFRDFSASGVGVGGSGLGMTVREMVVGDTQELMEMLWVEAVTRQQVT